MEEKTCARIVTSALVTADFSSVQVTMTASTLLEAVEPTMLWRQLLGSIFEAIDDGSQLEVCRTTAFDLSLCDLGSPGDPLDPFPSS